jgi:hypothetical protein
LDEGLTKIGRALAGGHLPSIAKAVFAHNGMREEVLLKVMTLSMKRSIVFVGKLRRMNLPRLSGTFQYQIWKVLLSKIVYVNYRRNLHSSIA